jgi:hypothetical protein
VHVDAVALAHTGDLIGRALGGVIQLRHGLRNGIADYVMQAGAGGGRVC